MSAGIEYLPLEDGDVGKLLCLYQESYPMLGWSERQLRWQYFDNPAGRAKVWLAKSGGRIVATCAAIPHRIVVRGATGLGWRVQDVITRPEFRGRGIYHHLSAMIRDELFDQQHAFNFTFPNDNTHNGFIRNGWTDLFRVPLHVMADIETVPYRESVTKVTPIQAFDEATDRVWESCRTRIDFAVDRSADYLQWRYFANPKGRYFPFRIERACNELVVVLKYYDHEGGSRWGHICDLFCAEDDARLVADAVDHAINFSRALGCGVITCWCQSGSSLAGALAAAGFALKENLDRWVVGNLNAPDIDAGSFADETRWHLAMGDSDVY